MRKRAREEAEMEEATMMAMMLSNEHQILRHPTTPFPSWKLYENPFYSSANSCHQYSTHQSQLPLSARKLAASLWDLSFFELEPDMDAKSSSDELSLSVTHRRVSVVQSDLDLARARIVDLKAEVEFERRMRKKAEAASKKLAREVAEEKEAREAAERAREEMAGEVARMRKEMEEEKRMLRMAEVWREERVQMKLADARLLMEEKLAELAKEKEEEAERPEAARKENLSPPQIGVADLRAATSWANAASSSSTGCVSLKPAGQRRGSPEAENPHIVRGIKGFVEFPRVIRAVGSRARQMGSKVECQKAQLKLLLRHRSPVGVAGATSLVVG